MVFKYRGDKRKVEDVAKRAKNFGRGYDSYVLGDYQMFKAKEGENTIRVLPQTWDTTDQFIEDWAIGIWIHFGVGPDNGTYLCLDKMKGEPCPVCEAQLATADPDERSALRPTQRALVWLIDRNAERAGPQWYAMPSKLYKEIQNRVQSNKDGLLKIDHPDDGFDISFMREGSDKHTSYSGADIDRRPSAISDDEKRQTRWLSYIEDNPLPEVLNYFEPEHIEKVLFGQGERRAADDDDDADEEEDKRSARRRASRDDEDEEDVKPARGKSRKPADDEDEDEEDEKPRGRRRPADEDDDDEAKPVRGKSRKSAGDDDDEDDAGADDEDTKPARVKSRKPVEDDDEDDADDADEDEDEKPVSRGARRRPAADEEDEDDGPRAAATRKKPGARRPAPADDDDDTGEDDPPKQAKKAIGRLRSKRER